MYIICNIFLHNINVIYIILIAMQKRINKDILNLSKSAPDLEVDGRIIKLTIKGPKDSLYENGVWKIRIEISKEYPYKSPSVGFLTKIWHPNVDYRSGSICLNVLNETWTPIYNLCHIIDTFIPQLLLYPNANDPLNEDAAALYLSDINSFKITVKNYMDKYCPL